MALAGRGRNYPRFRASINALEKIFFYKAWPAKLAFKLRLQNNVKLTRYAITPGHYPPNTPPLKIGFLSDFHAGLATHPQIIRRSIDRMIAEEPDVILLGGDFVDFDVAYLKDVIPQLKKLRVPLGLYAVLGNHDLWSDDARIQKELQDIGVEFLINRGVFLPPPFNEIYLCGLDEWLTGHPEPVTAFAKKGKINLVLMHNPANYLDIKSYDFDVAFCGHTHAGQVALPFGFPIVMPRQPYCRKYSYGKYQVGENGASTLIVTSGIGYHLLPFRFIAWPEVVICTIQ